MELVTETLGTRPRAGLDAAPPDARLPRAAPPSPVAGIVDRVLAFARRFPRRRRSMAYPEAVGASDRDLARIGQAPFPVSGDLDRAIRSVGLRRPL